MQQARMILAVLLSMLVFFVYYTYIDPPQVPQPGTQQKEVVSTHVTDKAKPQTQITDTEVLEENIQSKFPIAVQGGEQWVLENNDVKLVINSVGARIQEAYLKKYPTASGDHNLLESGGSLGGLSLSPALSDFKAVYKKVDSESGAEQIVLLAQLGDLQIKKTYRLDSISVYGFEQEITVENKSASSISLEPQFWMSRHQKAQEHSSGFFSFLSGPPDVVHPVALLQKKIVQEIDPKKIGTFGPLAGETAWAGFTDRYFLTTFISRQSSQNSLTRYFASESGDLFSSFTYGSLDLSSNEKLHRKIGFFLGPKLRSLLQGYGVGLEQSVDYGWFSFVAVPLLWFLVFIQKIVVNWGVAIIVLTFIVKLLLHPVNKKSMESMKAMQKLQPRMKEIQEKYKGDREKLNMEMMQLFKTHKVNPMGGCLPMLLQMPIYIALYKVLWNAIELYRAPFFGMYQDLSAPDPYFIAPIVLGILFYFQQKLTPSSASMDPAQQKVMQFMPVMFTAFMIFLPSGLLLYIIVNTLMSVIQQYMMHKEISFMDLLTGKRNL